MLQSEVDYIVGLLRRGEVITEEQVLILRSLINRDIAEKASKLNVAISIGIDR